MSTSIEAILLAAQTLDNQPLQPAISLVKEVLYNRLCRHEAKLRGNLPSEWSVKLAAAKCMPLIRMTARQESNRNGTLMPRKTMDQAALYLAEQLIQQEETRTY